MIELLTPPAKGEPVTGAKGAAAAPGGIDFAALFGTVAPATTDAKALPTMEGAAVPTAAVPAPTLPTVPGLTLPAAAVDAAPAPAVVTPPVTTATPIDPSADPAPVLAAAAVPVVDGDADEASAIATPVSLAAKPMTIRPHGPIVVEDESVKLPTLPADFVAQKAPRIQPAAEGDVEDKDEAEPDETAAAPPAPTCAAPVAPTQAQPAPDVAASVAATIIGARRAGVPTARLADKADPAAKADAASLVTATATDGQADAAPLVAVDTAPPAHATTVPTADQGAAASPTPVLNPALPTAAPAAAPIIDTSAIPVSTRQSVALDDLMIAGAGDSAWLDRLSTDITTLASGNSREAHMKLNPHSLGDMSIRLDMDGQSTRVHFTVETRQAATLISDGTQKLTSLVQANGLKLDGATVDLSQRRGDGRPSDQNQRQAEAPAAIPRARSETARLIERTRIAVATERFA